jgi:hypothetical protein
MDLIEIERLFTYHAPNESQKVRYEILRGKAKELALAIEVSCPNSADKSAAMRKLRECIMTANASIALE